MARWMLVLLVPLLAACVRLPRSRPPIRVHQMEVRAISPADRAAIEAAQAEMAEALKQLSLPARTLTTGQGTN